jgi:hypothetical protein
LQHHFLYRIADRLFIPIRSCRVDEPVAYIYRITDAPLAFRQVRDLENAKPKYRHLHPVVQFNLFHISF